MLELAEQLDRSAARAAAAASASSTRRRRSTPAPTRSCRTSSTGPAATRCTGRAGTPWFLDEVDGHSRLDRMEQALRSCTLWLWLDLRFPGVYGHVEAVLDAARASSTTASSASSRASGRWRSCAAVVAEER